MSDASQGQGWWQASDGKWYPPESAASTADAPPPPWSAPAAAQQPIIIQQQKKGGCFRWIGIAVVVFIALIVIVAILAASGSDDSNTPGEGSDENPAADDVTLGECTLDPNLTGFVNITGEIVNHSSERSNYLFSINIEDPSGTKVGEAGGIENNIDPDQKAAWSAATTITGTPDSITCKITDVTRLASG